MKTPNPEYIEKDYPRFKFPGFGSEGTCYLRVRVNQTGAVVLCCQLLNYNGTSITNAAEQIFKTFLKHPPEGITLNQLIEKKPWWKIWTSDKEKLESIIQKTVWVEIYPPGTGLSPNGSIALVSFDNDLNPVWNYVSKKVAAEECGVEESFFNLNLECLNYNA